jgi:serine/threonine protein kinase
MVNVDLPNFSEQGYEVEAQLGVNPSGGRVTYLASVRNDSKVVIKQFQFVQGSDWSGFKAIEREIEVLKALDHPGIPKYLSSFETRNGVCLVQEYKNAQPLTANRSYDEQQIRSIARSALHILIYLQSLYPPVLHRDIQPGNLLLDANGAVYLVDFGFAKTGGKELAASSIVTGTMGFMAPEQLLGRSLTPAADLFGLGATLIGLITGTPSGEIGRLIDENFRFKFEANINEDLHDWLLKMVEPHTDKRYRNAQEALEHLEKTLRTVQYTSKKTETGGKITQQRKIVITNTFDVNLILTPLLALSFFWFSSTTLIKVLGGPETINNLIEAIKSNNQ